MKTNWQTKKLSEICDFKRGLTYSKKDEVDFSENIVLRSNNIDLISSSLNLDELRYIDNKIVIPNSKKIKKGSIIICTANGSKSHLGKIALIDKDYNYAFGGFMGQLIPNNEINYKYFFYILTSDLYKKHLKKISSGANINNLKFSDLSELQIPIPLISEQKRIVKVLDEVFGKLEIVKNNAENNLQNSKELFNSFLQGIFSNKGEGWEEKTLGDIGKPSMCKRILKHQTSSVGEIPFYKIGTFGKTPNAFISKEIYNEFRTKYSFPKKGDILISASGTIGRRVRYDGEPAFFQDSNIVWIDNDEKQVLNDYLYVFYEFCDWKPSKGATIARLYNSNLTSIKIVFPKSIGEQKEVIKKLDELSNQTKKLEVIYKKKLVDLEELKKSVLKKAFSGEL